MKILLVGCSASKQAGTHAARDLYTGQLFQASRRYAEASGHRWMIFSGLHGLIEPTARIESYDQQIPRRRDADARRALLNKLVAQVLVHLAEAPLTYEVHAGHDYVEALRYVQALHPRGTAGVFDIETPLAGLQIGQRKAWYACRS